MNNRTLLLVLIICGLFLAALITRKGELLSLALPMLVYLIFGLVQAPTGLKLEASRALDKSGASTQDVVEAHLLVKNRGNALVNLYLADSLFPSIEILEGQAQKRLSLAGGESTEFWYRFKAGRGIYSWKKIHACASDPFELFELNCDLPATGEILIRPAPMRIRPLTLQPRATLHTAGPLAARLAGSGTDFWGIREYRAGDSLRRVNWRLAARHPHQIFTNEYEREEIADYGMILDARKLTNADAIEEAIFEHSVSAAAGLAENFLRSGNRVSLLVFGKTIFSVFPGYGKKQINSVQRKLARARLEGYVPFNHFEHFSTRLFPTHSLILILSAYDSRDLETYARLRSFGYDVLLISPDPVEFASQRLPVTETNRLASRAAKLERTVHLGRLLKLGVRVINWPVNQPLENILYQKKHYLNHRRNV